MCVLTWPHLSVRGEHVFSELVADNSIGSHDPPSFFDMAVGVTVVLGLVMVSLIVAVVWLWRQQWTLPCAGKRGPVHVANYTVLLRFRGASRMNNVDFC